MTSTRPLDLRIWLVLLLLGTFAILTALFLWQVVQHDRERLAQAHHALLAEARILASQQQAIRAHASALAQGLTFNPHVHDTTPSAACDREMERLLKYEPRFINAGIVRPDGSVICSAHPDYADVTFVDRSWFQAALAGQQTVVSDLLTGRITQRRLFTFAHPLRDEAGELTNVLFLAMDIEWLEQQLSRSTLPAGSALVLVDHPGRIVARYPPSERLEGLVVPDETMALARRVGLGTAEAHDPFGTLRIAAIVPFLQTDSGEMMLWLTLPRSEVTTDLRRQAALQLLVALLVIIATLLFAYWVSFRTLLQPLAQLAKVARRCGQGDRSARSGLPHDRSEIGQLAHAIDTAADQVVESERELARAKEAAEAANAVKGRFLTNMSHETRTPLNAILGMAELLHDEPLTPTQRGYVDSLDRAGARLLELIDQALLLANAENDALADAQPFDPRALLRHALDGVAQQAHAKGLTLHADWDALGAESVIGNQHGLRQVINHLLDNAIKFTPAGTITLHAREHDKAGVGQWLWVAVSDSGIGIDEAQIERIFEPFYQADESMTRRYGGSGLGLSVAHQIVQQMGGRFCVRSTPGEGTTMAFAIPLDGDQRSS